MTQYDSLLARQLDEYRLISQLGRGGMARVYLGLDAQLKRYVAIKTIDKPLRADPDYAKRFANEAQTIAQLEHPHIVRIYRYGEAEGVLYIAMQYIKGASLDTILASFRKDGEFMRPQEVVRVIGEICLALDYAHSQGVIHRDIKPSNIMLDEQGRVFLTDFGLSFQQGSGTQGEVFGTPQYMAPEQVISSANVVPQSDLYAVGVILYEIFTGQIPFDGPEPLTVARQQLEESPPPPRTLRPEVSPEVDAVILKALAKQPEERFQSGEVLVKALESALRGVPVAVAPLVKPQTIHQRVTMLEEPLPPLPAAVAKPAVQPSDTAAHPTYMESTAGEPTTRRHFPLSIVAGFAGLLLLLVLCVVAYGLLSGLGNTGGEDVVAGIGTGTNEINDETTTRPTPTMATPTLAVMATATTSVVSLPGDCSTPLVLFAEADAWIEQNSPSNNKGDDSILKVKSQRSSDNFRTLVRFALPTDVPTGCVIEAATLNLYSPSWTDGRTLEVLRLATNWEENDVTWSNQPSTVGAAATTTSGQYYREWDITVQVQAIVEVGANHGFLIRDAREDSPGAEQQFHGREKGENQPMLIITFSTVPILDATNTETIAAATETPLPTVTSPTNTPYQLLLVTNREDSLFVVNQSDQGVPLDGLQLGDGNSAIQGSQWGVALLEPGYCVTAWKDSGNPKPPNVDCIEIGPRIIRDRPNRFWKSSFTVYYNGNQIGTCNQQCQIEIPHE